MNKKKITILSHNLSYNCLGRAYILAKALSTHYAVEIIGPMTGEDIWEPVRDDKSILYKKFKKVPNPITFIRAIEGDILYVVKPRAGSFGYALLAKIFTRKKIVLDIDDWEMGFVKDFSLFKQIKDGIRFWEIDNTFYTWLMDICIRFADAITVSNTFLQRKFGGTLIPHFRDTYAFDPAKFDRDAIRKELGVQDKKVVMFFGTIREHKGINTLLAAFDILHREDIVLMLVGADEQARSILPKKPYLKVFGRQPFEKVPEFLAACDVVALMQNTTTETAKGQLPAKIFDAMSMAKPIISTKISDIPTILEGCGMVIDDDPQVLAKVIVAIVDNPDESTAMGLRARTKCIEHYSYEAIRPSLVAVFESTERKGLIT